MSEFKRADFHLFRNNEHFQYGTEFKDLVVEFTPEKLKIEALFNQSYLPLYAEEDEALMKIVKGLYTDERGDGDRVRDQTFRGMADLNNSGLNHFDAEVQAAAKRLKILFDTFGNVAQLPLNEETSAIYNLLQEIRGKYAADAEKVGLMPWADKLEADNMAFEALTKSGYDEEAAKSELKMKEVRSKVDKVYRDIIARIEALMLIEGRENYADFVRRLNVVLEKYINTIAQRKGKGKK